MTISNADLVLHEVTSASRPISMGRLMTNTRLNVAELYRCLDHWVEQGKLMLSDHDTVHTYHNLFIHVVKNDNDRT